MLHRKSLMLTRVMDLPDKPILTIMGKVHHSRSYQCYVCGFKLELQVTFVQHFTTKHPGQCFKYDFCQHTFNTCNGLFKYKRSHQYLHYRCDLCGHKTQFLYQMKVHYHIHSGKGLVKCDLCECCFACKSSRIAHQKTHTTKLTCDKCASGTSKVYTSNNSLRLHVQGKHGPG